MEIGTAASANDEDPEQSLCRITGQLTAGHAAHQTERRQSDEAKVQSDGFNEQHEEGILIPGEDGGAQLPTVDAIARDLPLSSVADGVAKASDPVESGQLELGPDMDGASSTSASSSSSSGGGCSSQCHLPAVQSGHDAAASARTGASQSERPITRRASAADAQQAPPVNPEKVCDLILDMDAAAIAVSAALTGIPSGPLPPPHRSGATCDGGARHGGATGTPAQPPPPPPPPPRRSLSHHAHSTSYSSSSAAAAAAAAAGAGAGTFYPFPSPHHNRHHLQTPPPPPPPPPPPRQYLRALSQPAAPHYQHPSALPTAATAAMGGVRYTSSIASGATGTRLGAMLPPPPPPLPLRSGFGREPPVEPRPPFSSREVPRWRVSISGPSVDPGGEGRGDGVAATQRPVGRLHSSSSGLPSDLPPFSYSYAGYPPYAYYPCEASLPYPSSHYPQQQKHQHQQYPFQGRTTQALLSPTPQQQQQQQYNHPNHPNHHGRSTASRVLALSQPQLLLGGPSALDAATTAIALSQPPSVSALPPSPLAYPQAALPLAYQHQHPHPQQYLRNQAAQLLAAQGSQDATSVGLKGVGGPDPGGAGAAGVPLAFSSGLGEPSASMQQLLLNSADQQQQQQQQQQPARRQEQQQQQQFSDFVAAALAATQQQQQVVEAMAAAAAWLQSQRGLLHRPVGAGPDSGSPLSDAAAAAATLESPAAAAAAVDNAGARNPSALGGNQRGGAAAPEWAWRAQAHDGAADGSDGGGAINGSSSVGATEPTGQFKRREEAAYSDEGSEGGHPEVAVPGMTMDGADGGGAAGGGGGGGDPLRQLGRCFSAPAQRAAAAAEGRLLTGLFSSFNRNNSSSGGGGGASAAAAMGAAASVLDAAAVARLLDDDSGLLGAAAAAVALGGWSCVGGGGADAPDSADSVDSSSALASILESLSAARSSMTLLPLLEHSSGSMDLAGLSLSIHPSPRASPGNPRALRGEVAAAALAGCNAEVTASPAATGGGAAAVAAALPPPPGSHAEAARAGVVQQPFSGFGPAAGDGGLAPYGDYLNFQQLSQRQRQLLGGAQLQDPTLSDLADPSAGAARSLLGDAPLLGPPTPTEPEFELNPVLGGPGLLSGWAPETLQVALRILQATTHTDG